MAMIKKLSIQGVRSFSPADSKGQWLEFGSPLTLILGVNGSGKTTIIETLKYAITSQFPPNSSKGASFVNDPKLSCSDMALAKISLIMADSSGSTYVATRKVKTTIKNKKGDLSTQQLEGTLRIKSAKGEVRELTNKCGEMKYEMCRLMGVSEAILNHVIFCHQEESCWPLDEGKKVKETFDAIFNTTAYKKCFDRLNAIDKDLQAKAKLEGEGLKYVKENREMVLKFQDELMDKKVQLQQQSESIKEYDRDIKEMEKKLKEFQQLEKEYTKKQDEVTMRKTKLEGITKGIDELRKNIKEEFSGGITDLKRCIKDFKSQCLEKENLEKEKVRAHRAKEEELANLTEKKSDLLKEEGKFQQEESTNKKRIEELSSLFTVIVQTMKDLKEELPEEILSTSFTSFLNTCSEDPNELSYENVNKLLLNGLKMKESELQSVKSTFEEEEKTLQSVIDEVRSKKAAAETQIQMKNKQLADSRKTFEETKTRLKALDGSNERLILLDQDEKSCDEEIEALEGSEFMVRCDSEIKELTSEIKSMDSKVSSLESTVKLLNADKSKTDQITMLNRQKALKQNEKNELMRKMEDELTNLLTEIPKEGILKTLDGKIKSLNKELKDNQLQVQKKEKDYNSCKFELDRIKKDLKSDEKELQEGKAALADTLDGRDYDAVFEEVSNDLETAQADCSYAESAGFLFKKYRQKLNKSNCCPLCKRDFETQALLQKLIKELETDITRMNENVPELKAKIEVLRKRQESVLKAKPIYDKCSKIENENIPQLKAKMLELEEKLEGLNEETENVQMVVSDIQRTVEIGNQKRGEVVLYENCDKEMLKTDQQIANIEKTRDPKARDCPTTLTDAQTQLEELKNSISRKRSEKETKEDSRNKKRDELSKLKEKKNKIKEDKLRITAELQNRDALETQKKDLEKSTKELQVQIKELNETLPGLKNEIAKADKNKQACVLRKETALKKLRGDREGLERQKNELSTIQKGILEFEKKKGRFADLQKRITDCDNEVKVCQQEKSEVNKEINSLKDELARQQIRERELQDNLSLMEKLEEASQLKEELKIKEEVLSQAENRGVATESRELNLKWQQTTKKHNVLLGSVAEVKVAIKDIEAKLNTKQYANAEKEYVEKLVKQTVYQKGLQDVRRYKTALDVAIMEFHKKRMEKINKILLEYWRKIYKGNDIDKIAIKTEAEQDPDADSKKKVKVTQGTQRKSYNYRVVATRNNGVEIDMRGRCSAGQKVLASIIIRIALAESFGARCGIISLDEPTTNLDQKNINSLADALSDLAEKMSARKNFQLIIITHDKEFVQRLSGIDAVEHYWKVDRDPEGFSQIQQVRKRSYDDVPAAATDRSAL